MAVYGYLRVSTNTGMQTTDNQEKAITDAGFSINEFFSDSGVSGSVPAFERPSFKRMLDKLVVGDTVIVVAVDRLGRSASDILQTVEHFKSLGVKVRIMQFDGVDVTSPMGKMILTCMSAFAELEKNLIVERVNSGIARTRSQGTVFGAPSKLSPDDMEQMITDSRKISQTQLAKNYGVGLSTVKRNLKSYSNKSALVAYRETFGKKQEQHSINKFKGV